MCKWGCTSVRQVDIDLPSGSYLWNNMEQRKNWRGPRHRNPPIKKNICCLVFPSLNIHWAICFLTETILVEATVFFVEDWTIFLLSDFVCRVAPLAKIKALAQQETGLDSVRKSSFRGSAIPLPDGPRLFQVTYWIYLNITGSNCATFLCF